MIKWFTVATTTALIVVLAAPVGAKTTSDDRPGIVTKTRAVADGRLSGGAVYNDKDLDVALFARVRAANLTRALGQVKFAGSNNDRNWLQGGGG